MLVCQQCLTNNKDGSKFCKNCGGSNLYDPDAEIKKKKAQEEQKRKEEQRAEFIKDFKNFLIFIAVFIFVCGCCYFVVDYRDKTGCINGDDSLCVKVANKYKYKSSAIKYYEKSCELGNIQSCEYLIDNGGTKDKDYYMDMICGYGAVDYCLTQAKKYEEQNSILKANLMYQKACDNGNSLSCDILSCNSRNADKCFDLAKKYNDLGNYQNSNKFYKKACDLNDGAGCINLGYNYKNGDGFTRDINKGNELYRKGCDLNNGLGCTNLGINYQSGNGVTKDISKANELYKKACDLNNGLGCKNLGINYQSGNGVTKDISKANKFYKKGCNLNDWFSCEQLKRIK